MPAAQWALIYDPQGEARVETADFGASGVLGVALRRVDGLTAREIRVVAMRLATLMVEELARKRA